MGFVAKKKKWLKSAFFLTILLPIFIDFLIDRLTFFFFFYYYDFRFNLSDFADFHIVSLCFRCVFIVFLSIPFFGVFFSTYFFDSDHQIDLKTHFFHCQTFAHLLSDVHITLFVFSLCFLLCFPWVFLWCFSMVLFHGAFPWCFIMVLFYGTFLMVLYYGALL
jgi:hypothetical protein